MTIEQINQAIANGETVTAIHSDLRRAGQPNPGAEVRVTQAFSFDGNRVRVNAEGYKGRFAVVGVRFASQSDSTPDTY